MVLHFVGPRELFTADGARENLALTAFVIEEGVPLEAVLVLEGFDDVHLGAFNALVDAWGNEYRKEKNYNKRKEEQGFS